MPTHKQLRIAVAFLFTVFSLFLISLAVISRGEVNESTTIILKLSIFILVYNGSLLTVNWFPDTLTKVSTETFLVLTAIGFIYKGISPLQLVLIDRWQDATIIQAEIFLIGDELNKMIQGLYNPLLTEIMMFAYVAYIPLLPLVGYLCYRSAGMKGIYDYFFILVFSYLVCYSVFLIFPIASPIFYQPEYYAYRFEAGLFTRLAELLHVNQHYPGGAFPSPHCTATMVMTLLLYRYNRSVYYLTLPTMLLIFISTVYGGFHYVADSIAGILVALIVWRYAPSLLLVFTKDIPVRSGRIEEKLESVNRETF